MEMLPPSIYKEVVHDVCMEGIKVCSLLRSIIAEEDLGYQL